MADQRAPPAWKTFAQGGTWICAVIVAFVIRPPGHSLDQQDIVSWNGLARFLVAVINGLAVIAATQYSERAHLRHWVIICVSALLCGAVLLALYGGLMLPWTCDTPHGRFVIGKSLLPKGIAYQNGGAMTCDALLDGFAYEPLRIWSSREIYWHEIALGWLFVFAVSLLGLSIIALLQAYKITGRAKTKTGGGGNIK